MALSSCFEPIDSAARTIAQFPGQPAHDRRFHFAGNVRAQRGQSRWRLRSVLSNQLRNVARKRRTAAQHVISDCRQGINICAHIQLEAGLHLLRRHVFGVPTMPREAGPLAEVASDLSWPTIFARPKSPTLINPSPPPVPLAVPLFLRFCVMKMLAGFRSRCRMPAS